jgi:hypothetical protein
VGNQLPIFSKSDFELGSCATVLPANTVAACAVAEPTKHAQVWQNDPVHNMVFRTDAHPLALYYLGGVVTHY